MNKKRLYKPSGELHERGKRLQRRLNGTVHALFMELQRYHPRDLEILLIHLITLHGSAAAYRHEHLPTPESVKSA